MKLKTSMDLILYLNISLVHFFSSLTGSFFLLACSLSFQPETILGIFPKNLTFKLTNSAMVLSDPESS